MTTHTRWFLAAALATSFSAINERPALADLSVKCFTMQRSPAIIECIISEPLVTGPFFTYPKVHLEPGDDVTVNAGGCVQVGGHGLTWKNYVHPSGSQSDRYYFGTLTIGQSPVNNVAFRDAPNGVIHTVIRKAGPDALKPLLGLGYPDDEWDDNGYYNHDDGDDDQCKGIGPAFVAVTIRRGFPPETSGARERNMDLDATEFDPNGFLLNPRWHWQLKNKGVPDLHQLCGELPLIDNWGVGLGDPPCATDRPQMDDASDAKQLFVGAFGLCWGKFGPTGHVNWDVATYTGELNFLTHDQPEPEGDDDYNFSLFVPRQAGLTTDNGITDPHPSPVLMNLEFDSDEVVDHMDQQTWWTRFHQANDNWEMYTSNPILIPKPHLTPWQMLHNLPAIVTGLFGTDTTHGLVTELHPIYSMAVKVGSNANTDSWAIFVRNWGDEGECAQDDHPLDVATDPPGEFLIRIPWREGATDVVSTTNFFQQNGAAGPDIKVEKGKEVLLMFTMPDAESQGMVYGDLNLSWIEPPKGPAPSAKRAPPKKEEKQIAAPKEEEKQIAAPKEEEKQIAAPKEEEPESGAKLIKLVASMTPAQHAKYQAKYRELVGTKPARRVSHPSKPTGRPVVARIVPAGKYHPQPLRQPYNRTRGLRHLRRAEAICFAFDGKVPGSPNACPKPPKPKNR
jgi:hypothetical protein